MRLFGLLLCVAFLIGCSKTYTSQADYEAKRLAELQADEAKKTSVELADGSKWQQWELGSGQAWLDKLSVEGEAVRVSESLLFESGDDAAAWVAEQNSKGKPPTTTFAQYRESRQAELGAASGAWVGNTDGGHFFAWQMPDGSYTVDTVRVDGQGGATFSAEESKPSATLEEAQALAAARAALTDYVTKRSTELSGTADFGASWRNWIVVGFKTGSGVTVDVLRPEPDNFNGMLVAKTQTFASVDEAATWIASQRADKQLWSYANQYQRNGWMLIAYLLLIIFFVLSNIFAASRGKAKSIRRIAGLDQIDEAVGRATEIARPVLMVPGLGQLNGITVQALTVFAYVIRTAARFGTPIRLLNADASVYAVAQEIARDVYMSEGVPEQYDPTSVRFVSDRQFAFAAGVAGTIQREKVAATFFMGDFFAESMIFAENANMVGAIQVAATTQFTQTPFFIAACDYVLLGDEFYAASAYLGRQPVLVGSLVGVDYAKMLAMATVLIAAITHSVQMTKPLDVASIQPETRAIWEQNNQKYYDWRKDDLFFNRLTKTNRN